MAPAADGSDSSEGGAWDLLEDRQDSLLEALEADPCCHPVTSTSSSPSKKALPKCQRCGVRGNPEAVPYPAGLRSCGFVPVTSWACALHALETPHCQSCGSTTPVPPKSRLGSARDMAHRKVFGRVTLSPCFCCSRQCASDAMICVQCGTTSPRGGLLVNPQLQRCARCGALVASDAGLCQSCGTANFRPASLFSPGPLDLRLVGCPKCGREIAADALLCVHCGSAWPSPCDDADLDSPDAANTMPRAASGSHWMAASEAIEAIEAAEHASSSSARPTDETSAGGSVGAAAAASDTTATSAAPADIGDFFGCHPLGAMAKECLDAQSERQPSRWDSFFDEDSEESDGRGLGLARRAG